MGCNCKWTEIVLAIVILVFTFWEVAAVSQWVVAVAAILLLLHALMCKNCAMCSTGALSKSSKKKGR
jgi:hypothetical protein